MEQDSKHFFITQSGLLGEGLPTHKTAYTADAKSYAMGSSQDTLEVRLSAREAAVWKCQEVPLPSWQLRDRRLV
jgi:YidC/Oxa1 family membrane protein insertase